MNSLVERRHQQKERHQEALRRSRLAEGERQKAEMEKLIIAERESLRIQEERLRTEMEKRLHIEKEEDCLRLLTEVKECLRTEIQQAEEEKRLWAEEERLWAEEECLTDEEDFSGCRLWQRCKMSMEHK